MPNSERWRNLETTAFTIESELLILFINRMSSLDGKNIIIEYRWDIVHERHEEV